MIHTTVGLYPNGEWKSNGVPSENLAEHIKYQWWRPGRTFFVDGVLINQGSASADTIEHFIAHVLPNIKQSKDTQPYV